MANTHRTRNMSALENVHRRCQNLEERLATFEMLLMEMRESLRSVSNNENKIATLETLLQDILPEARDIVHERRCAAQDEIDRAFAAEVAQGDREERQREIEERTYPCAICLADVTVSELYIVDECHHRFCRECILGHAKAQIRDSNPEITCPHVGGEGNERCQAAVDFHQIRELLALENDPELPNLISRFDELKLERVMQSFGDYARCPNLLGDEGARSPCNGWALRQAPGRLAVKCLECGHQFCIDCRSQVHEGSCAEFARFMAEHGDDPDAVAYHQYRHTHRTQRCPGCGTDIERTSGCNHMTCRCGTHFCYVCGQRAYQRPFVSHSCRLGAAPITQS